MPVDALGTARSQYCLLRRATAGTAACIQLSAAPYILWQQHVDESLVCCSVLSEHHLRGYEIGLVANLNPQTVDEAQALVPSLKVSHWRGHAAGVLWLCQEMSVSSKHLRDAACRAALPCWQAHMLLLVTVTAYVESCTRWRPRWINE